MKHVKLHQVDCVQTRQSGFFTTFSESETTDARHAPGTEMDFLMAQESLMDVLSV